MLDIKRNFISTEKDLVGLPKGPVFEESSHMCFNLP